MAAALAITTVVQLERILPCLPWREQPFQPFRHFGKHPTRQLETLPRSVNATAF
jgi:hypothetical protein